MIKWLKFKKEERGQSVVEFAIILPILIILLTLPLDFVRVINTKMLLDSAAADSMAQLTPDEANTTAILNNINRSYGDVLRAGSVGVEQFSLGSETKEDYTYYVYTSDKQDKEFNDRFDKRDSNYTTKEVVLQLSYDMQPVTFLGKGIFGDKIKIKTRKYTKEMYFDGYRP